MKCNKIEFLFHDCYPSVNMTGIASQIDVTQIVGESSVHPVPASTTPISTTAFEVSVSSNAESQPVSKKKRSCDAT